jgi:hypothetical protein
VALAAEKVGIDRSSAYQARKANPAFAASWERALVGARERLSFETGSQPAASSPPQDERILRRAQGSGLGAQDERGPLRLRGDEVVRASKAGKPCVLRAGEGRWCVDGEKVFLAELSASANVRAAARAAGISTVAVYNRRRQWPGFRAAWDEAKAEGYARLEMALLHAATATLDPESEVAEAAREDAFAGPEMSVDQAMKLLFHRDGAQGARGGRGRGFGWRRKLPDIEEVRAELLRKVAAMERAKGLLAAEAGSGRPGEAELDAVLREA